MTISGNSYIGGEWQQGQQNSQFQAWLPDSNQQSEYKISNASEAQLNQAVASAQQAFVAYRQTSAQQRAEFLNQIAEQILLLGDELLAITGQESGLPQVRLQGERGRTVNQLKAFANNLLNPIESDIEEAGDAQRQPLPKPATRLTQIPLGPVAVFGASNFPYAFSTLGGDTASALAAGCPVIVKGHPAHPGTGELMTLAIEKAIQSTGMPAGVFSMLQSSEPELSHQLVAHPGIKAVGFTGSQQVAMHLQKTICSREELIPFYGELGSINPQLILPQKAQQDGAVLAEQLCQSLLMGNGQFCTSPGIWLLPEGEANFVAAASDYISQQSSQTLLTQGIVKTYQDAVQRLAANSRVQDLAQAKELENFHGTARLFQTSAADFIADESLRQEVFGPSALIVTYQSLEQVAELVEQLEGQLTASIHATAGDIEQNQSLIEALSYKVGRLIYNQMPTGVEVCDSMNHGGPFPATTDVRSTSVGTMAYKRFLRPLCIQNQ